MMLQPPRKTLLIEGWRGINHSFALANQNQILELLKLPGLQLYHRDVPYAFEHWRAGQSVTGFSRAELDSIEALGEPLTPVDAVFRIASPYRAPAPDLGCKTVTFMITELGLADANFAAGAAGSRAFTQGENRIVTSSAWSRDRIVAFGFDLDKVDVVPLAVDQRAYTPVTSAERAQSRANLGVAVDETVFLNVGAAVWNKGIDVLLRAFAAVRSRGRRVRLILKDQRDVYGIPIEPLIREVGATCPALLDPATLAAISVVPGTLSRAQLRLLYSLADAYVSPYRAEGFNLPVLEAIACAVPVLVTRGGATDDFCGDDVAIRMAGRAGQLDDPQGGGVLRFIEPDLEAVVAAMDRVARGDAAGAERAAMARARVLERFSWANTAARLAEICVGYASERQPAGEPARAPLVMSQSVSQRQVLDLLGLLQPRAMPGFGKVRVGGNHDGGYVVPSLALDSDVVVSIGVGSDVSFDLELAERGARVVQFDHTVTGPPVAHAGFEFHRLGWGAAAAQDLIDFEMILRMSRIAEARRPLLKFDIEGAEYDVLAALDADRLRPFQLVVCELHGLAGIGVAAMRDRVRQSMAKLLCHHVPVHLHVNNYGAMAMVAGVPVPDVVELTLLRRDLDDCEAFSTDPIPGELDRPNHPFAEDICLTAMARRAA
jgi:glycosyltransferase involved in cell wall biosynthesis